MSIILKGIDLPKEKDEALLLLILGDGTVAEKIDSDRYEEMTDTQAIQIPTPHGRLIDADEFKSWVDDWYDCTDIGNIVESWIDEQPTILEED